MPVSALLLMVLAGAWGSLQLWGLLWVEQPPALGALWSPQSEGDDDRLFAVWLFPPGRSQQDLEHSLSFQMVFF